MTPQQNTASAKAIVDSGCCPGCQLPFTQISVAEDYHDRRDGAAISASECWRFWPRLITVKPCPWSSDDLYSVELVAFGMVG